MESIKRSCVVSCPIATRSGYGARSRDFVRALIESKPDWDISIISQKWGQTAMDVLTEELDGDLISRILTKKLDKKPNVWIQMTVANEFQPLGDFNIGVTAGVETTVFPPELMEGVNRMDLTLVSSNFAKEVIEKSIFDKKDKTTNQVVGQLKLEKPVEVLFEGIDLDVYDEKLQSEPRVNEALSIVTEQFSYLFVGHWLNGEFMQDRKNVSGLIWTFLNTFKNKSKAPALILKTSMGSNALVDRIKLKTMIENIKKQVDSKRLPNIYLLHSDLTDLEMNALYNHPKVRAHVSFTRGEGFGRPLLEATISGKPMIVSGWSGHLDFINSKFVSCVDGKLEHVHKSASNKFLLEESQWFTIDYAKASSFLLDVFKNYKNYLSNSRKHRKYTKDNFSFNGMVIKLGELINDSVLGSKPQTVALKLPTLKKVGGVSKKPEIKLPKLKKIK